MEVLARLTGLPIAYRDSPLACSINCMYFHLHDYMSQLGQPALPRSRFLQAGCPLFRDEKRHVIVSCRQTRLKISYAVTHVYLY